MHTVWVRLNAVVFFGLTVLLGLSCLAAFSKIAHSQKPSTFSVRVRVFVHSINCSIYFLEQLLSWFERLVSVFRLFVFP
jgi:hypothetical protein